MAVSRPAASMTCSHKDVRGRVKGKGKGSMPGGVRATAFLLKLLQL